MIAMVDYSFKQYDTEIMARAMGRELPISRKQSIEICNAIRKKYLHEAKIILQDAAAQKKAIPFRRFNRDTGHKPKIGPGRFAVKASGHILRLIKDAEANAQFKGLNTSQLIIEHISVKRAPTAWHYGRQSRRRMRRAHIEIVVAQKAAAKKEQKSKGTKK